MCGGFSDTRSTDTDKDLFRLYTALCGWMWVRVYSLNLCDVVFTSVLLKSSVCSGYSNWIGRFCRAVHATALLIDGRWSPR